MFDHVIIIDPSTFDLENTFQLDQIGQDGGQNSNHDQGNTGTNVAGNIHREISKHGASSIHSASLERHDMHKHQTTSPELSKWVRPGSGKSDVSDLSVKNMFLTPPDPAE